MLGEGAGWFIEEYIGRIGGLVECFFLRDWELYAAVFTVIAA